MNRFGSAAFFLVLNSSALFAKPTPIVLKAVDPALIGTCMKVRAEVASQPLLSGAVLVPSATFGDVFLDSSCLNKTGPLKTTQGFDLFYRVGSSRTAIQIHRTAPGLIGKLLPRVLFDELFLISNRLEVSPLSPALVAATNEVVAFGNTTVGGYADKEVELVNNGGYQAKILSLVSPVNPSFVLGPLSTCDGYLQPNTRCKYVFRFKPQSFTDQNDKAIFNYGDGIGTKSTVFLLSGKGVGAPGSLDSRFGTGGIITPYAGNPTDTLTSIVLRNGKILTAGTVSNIPGTWASILRRFNSNGTSDSSFYVHLDLSWTLGLSGPSRTSIYRLVEDSLGRVMFLASTPVGFYLGRLLLNGQFDGSFGSGGLMKVPGNFSDLSGALSMDSEGKIYVAGSAKRTGAGGYGFGVVKFDANGNPDGSFGENGLEIYTVGNRPNASDGVSAMTLDGKGFIYLAGYATFDESVPKLKLAVLKLNPSGELDPTFGEDGIVVTEVGQARTDLTSITTRVLPKDMLLQPDGNLVVLAHYYKRLTNTGILLMRPNSATFVTYYDYCLVRYRPNGDLDGTFANDGVFRADGGNVGAFAFSLALQPDGKFLVGMRTMAYADTEFVMPTNMVTTLSAGPSETHLRKAVLRRHFSGGQPDLRFGQNGMFDATKFVRADYLRGLSVLNDGQILVITSNGGDHPSQSFLKLWP